MKTNQILRRRFLFVFYLVASGVPVAAQVSITTAVDLALRNSPRVKMAEAEVTRTRALIAESKDVFIPSLVAGAGLGEAYGYTPNPPTLFNLNAGSLAYNASQFDYIRSAREGFVAATDSLEDTRQAVAEDAAVTFLSLDRDLQRERVLGQEAEYSTRLVTIVEDRVAAGRDTQIELTQARLSAAQLRLARLRTQDDTASDRAHLARLLGIQPASLTTEGGFPAAAPPVTASPGPYANPAVAGAFASARAKQESAWGDARYLYRPQFSLVIQYNRYATFTSAFKTLKMAYSIGANEGVFGVSIVLPLYDRGRRAKAAETAAEAARALHEAETAQMNALDGQSRLTHSMEELRARAEVATLEQQLAQQQLDALMVQLDSPPMGNGPQMTPKDEQNSRIAERERYLGVIDATFQLHQAEINLLRQTGQLVDWLRSSLRSAPSVP